MKFYLNGEKVVGKITENMGYQFEKQMFSVEDANGKEYLVEKIGREYFALKNQSGIASIGSTGTACGQGV